jgi:hypothetical protein
MSVNALAAEAKLTIPDLERAFREAEEMLVKLSCFYDETVGDLEFIGGDHHETALDWIRLAKCASIENYEQKIWRGDLDGTSTEGVSRKPLYSRSNSLREQSS